MNLIEKFIEEEKALYPGASVRIKDKLTRHKIIAYLIKPFNPYYMTDVTTTVFPHTDFGTDVAKSPSRMLKIEFHENVHKWDFRDGPIKAMLKYAFPQLYALPFIVAAVAAAGLLGVLSFLSMIMAFGVGLSDAHSHLNKDGEVTPAGMRRFAFLAGIGVINLLCGCVVGAGWWSLLLLGAALFVSPWPFRAVWRRDYELRGYTASLYQEWLRHGRVREEILDHTILQFTGPTYFYMETRRTLVRDALMFQVHRFQTNEAGFLAAWQKDARSKPSKDAAEPYRMIRRFFDKENMQNA